MGKKRKKSPAEQQPTPIPPSLAQVLKAMAAAAGRQDPSSTCEMAGMMRASGNFGRVVLARRENACCESASRDGIIVSALNPETLERAATMDGVVRDLEHTVFVVAFDEHQRRVVRINMDVESMERHVNNCTEVLAYIREQNAAAATGGAK